MKLWDRRKEKRANRKRGARKREPRCRKCGCAIYDGRPYYSHPDGTFECARLTDCYAKVERDDGLPAARDTEVDAGDGQ